MLAVSADVFPLVGCGRNRASVSDASTVSDAADSSKPMPIPDGDAESGPGDGGSPIGDAAGGGDAMPAAAVRLCDGTSGLRLRMSIEGGGQSSPGPAMLAEHGFQFLMVDGSCHAWVLDRTNNATGELVLDAEQERALTAKLRLDQWSTLGVPAGGGCPDAPTAVFILVDQRRLSGPTCGVTSGTAWAELVDAFRAVVTTLRTAATPLRGDVRYLVTEQTAGSAGDARQPVPWPLAVPIENVAVNDIGPYAPGTSVRATGEDAAALRAIRTIGGGSAPSFDYTPTVAATRLRYRLYIRDALPFEN
jgi:hypothetical protein